MNYGARVVSISDVLDVADGEMCACCGRPMRGERSMGPLVFRSDPPELFWRGLKIENISPVRANIISLLIRFGMVSYDALILALPTAKSGIGTLHVHVHHLRRQLRRETGEAVQIVPITGVGYKLVVEE